MSAEPQTPTVRRTLQELYGTEAGEDLWKRIVQRLADFAAPREVATRSHGLTAADSVLITYGDQFQRTGSYPLAVMAEWLPQVLGETVSAIHLLPFFPYSSDDGFSVIDYYAVEPTWGGWDDIAQLGRSFDLMFDAVINHMSQHSAWFNAFLRRKPRYANHFVTADPNADLSAVVRPRALPLLTPFETTDGPVHVWTTFSADQVDLNYAEPDVLFDILDVLLFYCEHGAKYIRLDAIAFMWKAIGTTCIHLPETHRLIQIMRAVLDEVAGDVLLISETNVPHAENISYFGSETDEAQLVYQFTLPPLVFHTLLTGDASVLQRWAASLETPTSRTTFFNFLASHDGIGVRPVEGILPDEAVTLMVDRTLAHGGKVSYRAMPDGSERPYELNIVYFDALSDPASDEPNGVQVDRFILAHSILLTLAGIPAIYVHSLFGSRSWPDGVAQTGHNRTINRQKFDVDELSRELNTPTSLRARVYSRMQHLLQERRRHSAFAPNAAQRILPTQPALYAVYRGETGEKPVLCVHNVTGHPQSYTLPTTTDTEQIRHLIDTTATLHADTQTLHLPPYAFAWLALGW